MKTDLKDYLKNKEGFIVVFMSGQEKRIGRIVESHDSLIKKIKERKIL